LKVSETVAVLRDRFKTAPEPEKPKIEVEIGNLINAVASFLATMRADYKEQVKFLQTIMTAARNRGTIWAIGDTVRDEVRVFAGWGRLWARDGINTSRRKDDWPQPVGDPDVESVSVTRTRRFDPISPRPYLSIVAREPLVFREFDPLRERAHIRHGQWPLAGDRREENTKWKTLDEFQGCRDVQIDSWPQAKNGTHVDRLYFVVVPSDPRVDFIEFLANPTNMKIERLGQVPRGWEESEVHSLLVRPVLRPRSTSGEYSFASDERVIYVYKDSYTINRYYARELDGKPKLQEFLLRKYVNFGADFIRGMRVDSKYLWVFTPWRIWCVCHDLTAIRWLSYQIPADVGDYDPEREFEWRGERLGLLDLCACDDGTLTALFYVKCGNGYRGVFTMTPKVDFAKGTLTIEGEKRDERGNIVKTNG
jgi:hypothetical protein